jgi:hypothetical protein
MKSERDFLHDISTPVATALFILDSMLDSPDQIALDRLEKLKSKLAEMGDLIARRREQLKSEQAKGK